MESGAALAVARWIFFSSAMTVFGVALFPLCALRSSRDGEGVIGCQPLIFGAAVLALASSLAWLVLITVDFGGEDPASFVNTASTILFETDFGPAWLVRLAAVFALVASTALRLPEAVVLAPAAIVLGSEAWFGHSAIGGPIQHIIQIAHLLSAGAWLGGLVALTGVIRQVIQKRLSPERLRLTLLNFSGLRIISVEMAVITGLLNTWFVVGSISRFAAEYALVLVIKVALFLVMALIALFNRFRFLPQLQMPGLHDHAVRRFRQTVFLEQALGLAVLLAASVLGLTEPTAF